jgi:hypothetical protein
MWRGTGLAFAFALVLTAQIKGAASVSPAPSTSVQPAPSGSQPKTAASAAPVASAAPAGSSWTPPPKEDFSAWKPAPKEVAKGVQVIPQGTAGGVQMGVLPAGSCLAGFTRINGICMLSPALLPNLTKVIGLFKPGVIGPQPVTYASVLVEGALINSAKYGGACWDPFCNKAECEKAASAATNAIAVALKTSAGNPYLAAFAFLSPIIAKGWSTPDPYGYASMRFGAAKSTDELLLVKNSDTLTPMWNVEFKHVPIASNTFLRLRLWDADVDADDPIGTIMINGDELARVMKVAKSEKVRVNDQTSEQALFIYVSVLSEQ